MSVLAAARPWSLSSHTLILLSCLIAAGLDMNLQHLESSSLMTSISSKSWNLVKNQLHHVWSIDRDLPHLNHSVKDLTLDEVHDPELIARALRTYIVTLVGMMKEVD